MKTVIRHCKHIDPITNERLESCQMKAPRRLAGKHKTQSEDVIKNYCIPMKEMSSCWYYED